MGQENSWVAVTKKWLKPKLINISGKIIGKDIKNVLINYGLKYTPIPQRNLIELHTDIRKVRLIEFFAEETNIEDNSPGTRK